MLTFPDTAKIDADTEAAFDDPQPGDEFEEFASHWVIVVGRTGDRVAWLNIWRDGSDAFVGTTAEFRARYAYGSIPGYSVKLWWRGRDVSRWLTEEMAAALNRP